MHPHISVLLVEQEPDTISMISLLLSEIKECLLQVCTSGEEALLYIAEESPDLILFAYGLPGRAGDEVIAEMRRINSTSYIITSIPEPDPQLIRRLMLAGTNDCIPKDSEYVSNIVSAAKRALIRIAERRAFAPPDLTSAGQLAMDEKLPDLVFNLDRDGNLLYTNRAIQDLLGFDQKEVVSRPLSDFFEEARDRHRFEEYVEHAESQPGFRGLVKLTDKEGSPKHFEINCSLSGYGIYGVLRRFDGTESPSGEFKVDRPVRSDHRIDGMPPRIGPYKIITLLGAGSMGRVYKGFDEQLERHVAIKVVSQARVSDPQYVERFHREAKLLASITHPNIAMIYYFGSLEGLPYFCMEFMPGGSLENLLQTTLKLDPDIAVNYTMQIAVGLSKALEKGVVHMDVKPSNLMMADNDRVKIVDFGLARTNTELEQRRLNLIGTPLYIAPEQIQGGSADFRCDVYSLGLTFFQMLYGFVPHSARTVPEIFRRRLNEPLPAPESLDRSVPAELYRIIRRMTRRDPGKRYKNYSDLIEELESARRSLGTRSAEEMPVPDGSAVYMRGFLYDRPFPEIIGEIAREKMSGKLTLSWINLCKNIHFEDGKITAVLSNQEGEGFVDLLVRTHQITGGRAKSMQSSSSDLFLAYSSAFEQLDTGVRDKLSEDLCELASHVLQGLFSWVYGEFLFEEGDFPAQPYLKLDSIEVISRGIRSWTNSGLVQRRLHAGQCVIELASNFQPQLADFAIAPADAFILFRFDRSIRFDDLLDISGIPEDEFYKLIYLFACLGIVSTRRLEPERTQPAPAAVSTPARQQPAKEEMKERKAEDLPERGAPALREQPAGSSPAPLQAKSTAQEDLNTFYYQCALRSFQNKNYWAAVEYCKKALEHRADSGTYRLMGKALETHPAFRHEAMNAFRKALELSPENSFIERDIADLYFLTGNFALARKAYENFLRLKPGDEHAKQRIKEIQRRKK